MNVLAGVRTFFLRLCEFGGVLVAGVIIAVISQDSSVASLTDLIYGHIVAPVIVCVLFWYLCARPLLRMAAEADDIFGPDNGY